MDAEEILRRFKYHPPTEETKGVHDAVREAYITFAFQLESLLPAATREKSLMLTALEESQFWAHAHIARNLQ